MIFVFALVCFFGLLFALIGYIFQISDWKCPVHYIPPQFLRLWTTHGGMCVNFASCKMPRMIDIYFPTSQLDRNISLWCQTVFTSPPKCVSLSGRSSSLYSLTRLTRQIVRHLYSMFGFVIPRRPVALAHGVLAEQPMTDGGGRFGLWLDIGPKDRKRSWGLCPLHSRQKHTHTVQLENSRTEAERFAREAGSSILRFCRRSEAARSVES